MFDLRRQALQDEIDRLELMIARADNAGLRRHLVNQQEAHQGELDAIEDLMNEDAQEDSLAVMRKLVKGGVIERLLVLEEDPREVQEEAFREATRYSLL